ncbi:hypothetical protein HDU67_008815 [Dinochytrium kinnereticum]|nr:hypothetical protein HDU67_008815 [Dinochytrium kinnereticum]
MVISLTIPLDSSDCSIFLPIKCKEDALRIIFAIIAIIISSCTAIGDLIALTLTLVGIKLGLQKGEEDEDEADDDDNDSTRTNLHQDPPPGLSPILQSLSPITRSTLTTPPTSEDDDDVPDKQPGSPPTLDGSSRREWKVFRRAYSSSTEWVVPVGIDPIAQDVVEGRVPAVVVDLTEDRDLEEEGESIRERAASAV